MEPPRYRKKKPPIYSFPGTMITRRKVEKFYKQILRTNYGGLSISPRDCRWTLEGFVLLMEVLTDSRICFQKLDNDFFLPLGLLRVNHVARNAFQKFLTNNSTLISLNLNFHVELIDGDGGDEVYDADADTIALDITCFRVLHQGLLGRHLLQQQQQQHGSQLEELILSSNTLVVDWNDFLKFLASGAAPPKLVWSDVFIFNRNNNDELLVPPPELVWENCRVEELTMSGAKTSKDVWIAILQQVVLIPHLRKLSITQLGLEDYVKIDVTSSIVSILQHHTVLQTLQVDGFEVETEPIFEALANNSTLTKYDIPSTLDTPVKRKMMIENVLEPTNTTLSFVGKHVGGKKHYLISSKLEYYCYLNRYGRAKIRAAATDEGTAILSTLEFVNLLIHVQEDFNGPKVDFDLHRMNRIFNLMNIIFGLLMEAPSLWCHFH